MLLTDCGSIEFGDCVNCIDFRVVQARAASLGSERRLVCRLRFRGRRSHGAGQDNGGVRPYVEASATAGCIDLGTR
ncbi:MAG: hypothetical protein BVN32_08610 [Proteobacteria bacterium ST_bin14]|nr:MAG: hypothetical protein BVN32_08610 [Proteobacteria bacterium ST_bin14]